jgi:hypothetical protein
MTEVTDPKLLKLLNDPTVVSDPKILAQLEGRAPAAEEGPDIAEGMPWWEKALVGAGGGLRRTYLGAKDLVGQGNDAETQELKDWAKNKEALGGWGTAGEAVGDMATTAIPGGGGAVLGAKMLTKALPILSRVGGAGARVFNLGTAGRAATEGAISAGLQKPGEGETRLGNAATGGAVGAVLPMAAGAVGAPAKAAWRALSPTAKGAQLRAAGTLERTLGKGTVDKVEAAVRSPSASVLPRSTAAMADNTDLGALERSARGRGNAPFEAHDQEVARRAWSEAQSATDEANLLPQLEDIPDKLMNLGKAEFKRLALPDSVRDDTITQLSRMADSGEALARPEVRKELDNAIRALSHAEAGGEVLPQLVWNIGKDAGKSDTLAAAKKLLAQKADEISSGRFSALQKEFGTAADTLKGAEGAQAIRNTFKSEGGVPLTSRAIGNQAGADATPVLTSKALRTTLASKGEEVMDPNKVDQLKNLAEELRKHEIYAPTPGTGSGRTDMGMAQGVGSSAINASPLWRLRGAQGSLFGGANTKTMKALDNALLDPNKFIEMIEAKRALNRPLSGTEKLVEAMLRAQSRASSVESVGE